MKIKTLALIFLSLAMSISLWGYDFIDNGIYYNILSGGTAVGVTYRTTNYNSYSGSVTIPSSVSYSGKTYSVTSIGYHAFYGCTGLTSVTIPNSVTSIGDFAFYNCTGLTSVTLPNSVTSIGNFAFSGCTGLTNVTIPNSVTSIGGFAFSGCTGITAPLYNNTIFAYMPMSYSGSYTIPSGITTIADEAFYYCGGLTSLTIPNSVTSISGFAFLGCTGITAPLYNNTIFVYMPTSYSGLYTIPSGITTIVDNAFRGCTGLTSVTIPNSVTSIGNSAFEGCTGLTSVTIPNNVTSIGSSAFEGCAGLTSVTIPNSVTSIGFQAFCNCTGLTSVTIPNSVTSIGSSAFEGCTGLTSVTIPNNVTSIGSSAFEGCTGLTSVTIPNNVTSIGSSAFEGCAVLTSVTIPNSVTSIGSSAFSGCTGLTSVYFKQSTPPSIGSRCFNNANPTYYVPCGTTSAYQTKLGVSSGIVDLFLYLVTVLSSDTSWGTVVITQQPSCHQPAVIQVSAMPHYHLMQWSDGNTDNPRTVTVSSDTLLMAIFEIDKHTVSSNNDMVEGTGEYVYGSTVTLIAHSDEHRRFVSWKDGVADSTRSFVLQDDITMNAVYDIDSFLIAGTCQHGTVNGDGSYSYGSTAILTATADDHYHFVGWTDGNTDNPRTVNVTGDTTYTAIFEIDKHNVTATATNGIILGTGEYDYGSTALLTAVPDDYYCHVNWSDGDSSQTKSFEVTGDVNFTAEFEKCKYNITATCEHGIVTGSGTYENPDVVTLTVTPDEGYRFVKWSDDNEYNPRIFVARNDLTVEAICEEAPIVDDVENVEADTPAFYVIGTTVFNPSNEQLRVYSTEGKLLKSADTDIDLFGYPAGIYIVTDSRGNSVKMAIR